MGREGDADTVNLPYSLPSRSYSDPDVYREEMTVIFARTWLYAGVRSALVRRGVRLVTEVCEREIVVTRGDDGSLRAFAERPVAVEDFCGLLFVNVDGGAAPLREQVAEAKAQIRAAAPRLETLHLAHRRTYELRANWKNVFDNYSECYHCPVAHRSFIECYSQLTTYAITVHPSHHHHSSAAKRDDASLAANEPSPKALGGWYLWPSLALEVYAADMVSLFVALPRGPEHTTLVIEWHCARQQPSPAQLEVIEFLHETVRSEDIAIVESVQRGLRSRSFDRGPLMVHTEDSSMSEHAVCDFQTKVRHAMSSRAAEAQRHD